MFRHVLRALLIAMIATPLALAGCHSGDEHPGEGAGSDGAGSTTEHPTSGGAGGSGGHSEHPN